MLVEEEENESKLHFRKNGFKTIIGYAMGQRSSWKLVSAMHFIFE